MSSKGSRLYRTMGAWLIASSPPNPPEAIMDKFVERQNIANFIGQLETEADPIKRAMPHRLLTEEKVRQASHANAEK
jgi:hypothetical protein